MKKIIALISSFGIIITQAETLEGFLSATLLDQKIEKIEQSYHLDPGILKNATGYTKISELQYEKLTFDVNVFSRSGACKAYGIWKSQLRNLDKNGKLKHNDSAEIYDVFRTMLRELTSAYGEAPRLKFESRCCSSASGTLSQSYSWVNAEYALLLEFHDHVSTNAITLRQYRRGEKDGEFRGEDDLALFENLYRTQSGKLPDDWPTSENSIKIKTPRVNDNLDEHSDRQIGNDKDFEGKDSLSVIKIPSQESKPRFFPWIIGGIFLLVLLPLLFKTFNRKSS